MMRRAVIYSGYQFQHNYGMFGLIDRVHLVADQIFLAQNGVEGRAMVIAMVVFCYCLFLFSQTPVVLQGAGLIGGFCIR